jgi:hypothetical protein
MGINKVSDVGGLISYVSGVSSWDSATAANVVIPLGYSKKGGYRALKKLSGNLADCANHGASGGFAGFSYFSGTLKFFRKNRRDIVKNLEAAADRAGTDVIKLVQSFGVFSGDGPSVPDAGRALRDSSVIHNDLGHLYNAFAWFCFEGIANTRLGYLESHPSCYAELSAQHHATAQAGAF